jgi:hypothetical protein
MTCPETSPGINSRDAVARGSCKVVCRAEAARPLAASESRRRGQVNVPTAAEEEEENLRFLSVDQIETVSQASFVLVLVLANPRVAVSLISNCASNLFFIFFGIFLSFTETGSWIRPSHLSDLGSHINVLVWRVIAISLFQGFWNRMKQTRSSLVQGNFLINSA